MTMSCEQLPTIHCDVAPMQPSVWFRFRVIVDALENLDAVRARFCEA
jgi:hypothetical protein